MSDEWRHARKKPVDVEYRGPYTDPGVVETIEGDFEVDEEYLAEHGAYVIIRGVDGEEYPCALDIFEETYERIGPNGTTEKYQLTNLGVEPGVPDTMFELTCGECGETNQIDVSEVEVLMCPNCGVAVR